MHWAAQAKATGGAPYNLYMFLNSPTSSDTIDLQGPSGTCDDFSGAKQATCLAYNYGYNSAEMAMQYAACQGASSPVWWLDIENDICGQYWSCDQTHNSLTIQGALDYLHSEKLTAGIYSTQVQYKGITGGYVPSGPQIPIWVAGAYWTSPPYPASYNYARPRCSPPTAARSTPSPAARPGSCRRRLGPTATRSIPTTPAERTGASKTGDQVRLLAAHPHGSDDAQAVQVLSGGRVEVGGVVVAHEPPARPGEGPLGHRGVVGEQAGPSPPWSGSPRKRTSEASTMPPWPETTISSPGWAAQRS